jgi:hypothetical protein
MMRTLPLYSHHFLTIMCNVLMQYKVLYSCFLKKVAPSPSTHTTSSPSCATFSCSTRYLILIF